MPRKIEVIQKSEVFDDYDGKRLDSATEPQRYQFNGRTFDLYLSPDNRATVDAFIADLLEGADEVKGTRATAAAPSRASGLDEAEKSHRIAAYNRATGESRRRYTAAVDQWWSANGE